MNGRQQTWALILLVALLLGAAPVPAGASSASGVQVLTGPTAKYYGYLTPVVVFSKAGSVTYTNIDIERHDVVQDVASDGVHGSSTRSWCRLFPRGRCPIFYSRLIGLGQSEPVRGLAYVKPGRVYTFYCTLHPGMKGHLVVAPAGAGGRSS